jgi:hypothetical protein
LRPLVRTIANQDHSLTREEITMSIGYSYDAAYLAPGILGELDTVEAALYWGGDEKQVRKMGGLISGSSLDLANTPTDVLRPGMLLGKITSSGKLIQWDPAASNGSERIWGVLGHDLKVNLNGTGTDRFYGPVIVGGPIKASAIFRSVAAAWGNPGGLVTDPYERLIRQQMTQNGRFSLDDQVGDTPYTAGFAKVMDITLHPNYAAHAITLTESDHDTLFTNTGADDNIVVTLPKLTRVTTPVTAEQIGFRVGFFTTNASYYFTLTSGGAYICSPGVFNASNLNFPSSGAYGAFAEVLAVYDQAAGTYSKWLFLKFSAATTTVNVYGVLEARTATSDGTSTGAITAGTTIAQVTCGTAGYKVTLPVPTFVGEAITIVGGALPCVVIAASGTIDGIAYGTGVTVPALTNRTFVCSTVAGPVWVSIGKPFPGGTLHAATAATNGTDGTATIPAGTSAVTVTCSAITKGITLPTARYVGERIQLKGGAFSCSIYVGASGTIDDGNGAIAGATGAILPALTIYTAVCTSIAAANVWVLEKGPVTQNIATGMQGSATNTHAGGASAAIAASTTLARFIAQGTATAYTMLPVPLYLGQKIVVSNTSAYSLGIYAPGDTLIHCGTIIATTHCAVMLTKEQATFEATSLATGATDISWTCIASNTVMADSA